MSTQATPSATKAKSPEELKSGGFIPERRKGTITVRCKAPGGLLNAQRLRKIAEVAERYGSGEVHLSVRMSPEILHVPMEDLPALVEDLAQAGQEIASCGKRVRVPTACGGCHWNPNGLTETQRLAQETCDRFFGQDTPHKFKISFSGCPIDCMRTREMDLGFQGEIELNYNSDTCVGCGLCVRACEDDALELVDDKIRVYRDRCIGCGACVRVCPTDSMTAARTGHVVNIGGKHGKHPHTAYPIAHMVPEEQIPAVIEAAIAWYREHGQRGERIGDTLDRVGIDSLRRALKPVVGSALLQQKDLEQPRWRRIYHAGVANAFPPYAEV